MAMLSKTLNTNKSGYETQVTLNQCLCGRCGHVCLRISGQVKGVILESFSIEEEVLLSNIFP